MAARILSYVRRHHIGLLALGIAVVGVPTAWALARNSVGSPQIKPQAVHESDIADKAVTGEKVENGSLTEADFEDLPAGPQGPEGPQGPPGPVNLCRPGPVTIGPITVAGGAQTQTLCSDGPISILARCEPVVTGGPNYVGARLLYATSINDAIRVGDVDFDTADSPAGPPVITNSQLSTNPATLDFGISAGGDQLVGTVMASGKSTNTATGEGTCQFTAFGG